jgi:hypothetical protein
MNLKNGNPCRSNLVQVENGYLFEYFHEILDGCKGYFCQLLNAHGVSDVKQIQTHAARRWNT